MQRYFLYMIFLHVESGLSLAITNCIARWSSKHILFVSETRGQIQKEFLLWWNSTIEMMKRIMWPPLWVIYWYAESIRVNLIYCKSYELQHRTYYSHVNLKHLLLCHYVAMPCCLRILIIHQSIITLYNHFV